jgi:hypothetical protein
MGQPSASTVGTGLFQTPEAGAVPRGAKNQFAAFLQAMAFNLKRLLVLEPSVVRA